MTRAHVASLIAAGVIALGGGMAFAETGTVEDPPADVTTTTGHETTTTTVAETTTTTAVTEESTTTTSAADGDEHHGNVVSEAAHDHSHDAECGNHGKWVSAVAHGEESCESGDDGGEESDHATRGKGKDHAQVHGRHGNDDPEENEAD